MQGFPKHLNAKFDYEYVMVNFPKEKWQPSFEELLSGQKVWVCTGELTGEGITDGTHKIVESTDTDGTIKKYQYEYVTDANCLMLRLGYTAQEIIDILA